MELEELQKEWDAMDVEPAKSEEEVRRIISASRSRWLRSLTWKEILDIIVSVLSIVAIGYWGEMFESWGSTILALWPLLIVFDYYYGLRYLKFMPQRATVRKTLVAALSRIRKLLLISRIVNLAGWSLLVIVLALHPGALNTREWALLLLLIAAMWWNSRKWSRKKDKVNEVLNRLERDTHVPVS